MASDAINPDHYKSGPVHSVCGQPVEAIDICRKQPFTVGNAFKYLWRHGKKDPAKEIEDLEKAVWYIQDRIEELRSQNV